MNGPVTPTFGSLQDLFRFAASCGIFYFQLFEQSPSPDLTRALPALEKFERYEVLRAAEHPGLAPVLKPKRMPCLCIAVGGWLEACFEEGETSRLLPWVRKARVVHLATKESVRAAPMGDKEFDALRPRGVAFLRTAFPEPLDVCSSQPEDSIRRALEAMTPQGREEIGRILGQAGFMLPDNPDGMLSDECGVRNFEECCHRGGYMFLKWVHLWVHHLTRNWDARA